MKQTAKKPLICVPITGRTRGEINQQLSKVISLSPDVIEWRADFFEHLDVHEAVMTIIRYIGKQTNIPLLFTIRSEREGGEPIDLSDQAVVELLCDVSVEAAITYVDYEIANDDAYVETVRKSCEENNKQLILSYHHFTETPKDNQLMTIANRAHSLGAQIVKMAVMPHNQADVIRLLHLTNQLNNQLDLPIITMSMGEIGQISRVIGWVYGSMMTFAVGVDSSAPGQIEVKQLRKAIDAIQHTVEW